MSDPMSVKLAEAARTYREAPDNLKATILEAAEQGMKPAAITRAIDHAYTADYVARLIREHRQAKQEADS
ncbi:hypothetical protein [Streptomonospora wellingtoniae]|uniref:Antitoxin VbhA domain-containing protein n=1 Tax=Streptomonospora wellingtoniae TaxID=3075544 RepID=A0ABU2KUK2_9ACTN|nr:hypothetical protein [Streptomonospora sp. DSM 45055]MDT0302937.1 hypothetical protein [Streptomonospora sp. DSM 45055]